MRFRTDLHEAVIAIARDAATAIMEVYAQDFEVQDKPDHTPLTEADMASHRIITEALGRLTPDWPVLSEEACDIPWQVRSEWPMYWLVDPLDGTREFIKRNGEFSVNIALIEANQSVFGVVLAPTTGTVWYGVQGGLAMRRDGQGDTVLRTRKPAVPPLRVAVSRSHLDPQTEGLLQRVAAQNDGAVETVALGSSLKFCRIAEGALDTYPRFGPTSEWDTAAAQCVLEAAGGALVAPDGRAFRYNRRETLLNGDFIALGDPSLPWREWLD